MTTHALRVSLVLFLVVVIGACSSSSPKSGSTTAPGATAQAKVTASDSLMFAPLTVTVSVGQTVTWTNGGSIGHTVTFDSGPTFSQPLNAGASVTRTFTTA